MRPNSTSLPPVVQRGKRSLLYRHVLLSIMVIALVVIVLTGFFKQRHIRQLQQVAEELSHAHTRMGLIDRSIQQMYAADNHFRFYVLTHDSLQFAAYSEALQNTASYLDSIESSFEDEDPVNLTGMLQDKTNRARIFFQIKNNIDSLLNLRRTWDTLKEVTPPSWPTAITAPATRQEVHIDTITVKTAATPAKRKKLLGRLADAISNKKTASDSTQQVQVVKNTVTEDPIAPAISSDLQRRQAAQIKKYYSKLLNDITNNHLQLDQKEYEMTASNYQLLKILMEDMNLLKEQAEAADKEKHRMLNADIGLQLQKLNRETFYGALLIVILAVMILYMIVKSYRTGNALKVARDQALSFSKLKGDFVASMSHEIRTPLSSVIGFSEQLSKTKLSQEQEEILDAVNHSANMLLSVVNNVLDFSKLEEQQLNLEKSTFSPRRVIQDIVKGLQVQASRKGILLETAFGEGKDIPVNGDVFRFRQVLFNLTGNAIKFTHEGSVRIQASVKPIADKLELDVKVTDTGIGIPKQHLPYIFDAFAQVSSGNAHPRETGTGLGLTIVKRIIDLHGGKLSVQSTPGKGTTFHFTIPYERSEQSAEITETATSEAVATVQSHVLIVDDNNLNRRLLEMIMHKLDMPWLSAENGVEALQLLEQHHFDIVFTDIQMPVMDGLTLARRIRQMEDKERAGIPIVAITGNVLKEDLEMYLEAGINSYILKPFKEQDVLQKILELNADNA